MAEIFVKRRGRGELKDTGESATGGRKLDYRQKVPDPDNVLQPTERESVHQWYKGPGTTGSGMHPKASKKKVSFLRGKRRSNLPKGPMRKKNIMVRKKKKVNTRQQRSAVQAQTQIN